MDNEIMSRQAIEQFFDLPQGNPITMVSENALTRRVPENVVTRRAPENVVTRRAPENVVTRRVPREYENLNSNSQPTINITYNIENFYQIFLQENSMTSGNSILSKFGLDEGSLIPSGRLNSYLRDYGERKIEYASLIRMVGDITIRAPGREKPYTGNAAEIFWETPMQVDVLGILEAQKEGMDLMKAVKLDVHNKRTNVINSAIEDPNVVIYSDKGRIELDQALGVPRIHAENCLIKYFR